MYRELTIAKDKDRLLAYFHDEVNFPRWYQESTFTHRHDEASFLTFCSRHLLYEINNSVLLYIEQKNDEIVELHISTMRRADLGNLCEELRTFRDALFTCGIKIIYGGIIRQNRPLKKLCYMMGMRFNGLTAPLKTATKEFELQCFSIHRDQVFASQDTGSLLLSS